MYRPWQVGVSLPQDRADLRIAVEPLIDATLRRQVKLEQIDIIARFKLLNVSEYLQGHGLNLCSHVELIV
jgi:hypothetical protein